MWFDIKHEQNKKLSESDLSQLSMTTCCKQYWYDSDFSITLADRATSSRPRGTIEKSDIVAAGSDFDMLCLCDR